jgi:hypothetical protein
VAPASPCYHDETIETSEVIRNALAFVDSRYCCVCVRPDWLVVRERPAPTREECPILYDPYLALPEKDWPTFASELTVSYSEPRTSRSTSDVARIRMIVDRNGRVPRCAASVLSVSDSSLLREVHFWVSSLAFEPLPAPSRLNFTLRFVPYEEPRYTPPKPQPQVVSSPVAPTLLSASDRSYLQCGTTPGQSAISWSDTRGDRTAIIRGRVVGLPDGVGLPSAFVRLEPGSLGGITDSTGAFSIANVAPGAYVITGRKIGYHSVTDTIHYTGTTLDMNIALAIGEGFAHCLMTDPADDETRRSPLSRVASPPPPLFDPSASSDH